MDIALIVWRAVHFWATVQVGGVVIFATIIWSKSQSSTDVRRRLGLFGCSFLAVLISGAGWLLCVARAIDGTSAWIALQDGTALSLLTDTQFGDVWMTRLAAALALAMVALLRSSPLQKAAQLILGAILVGGLAFAGHGASSPGASGDIHLVADIFHLVAVTGWVGSLIPYVTVLRSLTRDGTQDGLEEALKLTQRYSRLATVSVLTILSTGIVNSLYLVGTLGALATSAFGQLLTLKILVFAVMLAFAAINRFVLMVRFSPNDISALNRNALVEFFLGALALFLVAAFGTMAPPL